MATNAPFPGVFRPGSKGVPVAVIQRTLKNKLGYSKIVPKGVWGSNTTKAVKDFQRRMGLPQSGNYGIKTHARLKGHMSEVDRALLRKYVAKQAAAKIAAARQAHVDKMVSGAITMIRQAPLIHYTQGSLRMSSITHKQTPSEVRWGDCSGLATYLYWWAGLPDPNGLGYNGYGYTGTLCKNGRSIPVTDARPGDLVFYGYGAPWVHVTVVISGAGYNATVFSHGSERGPLHVDIDYRSVGQVRRYF